MPTAFPRQDLEGQPERFLSVSRTDMVCEDAEIAMAERQAERADGIKFKRHEAWSALLNCGKVRTITDAEGVRPFRVTAEPIPYENDAHCGIHNSTGKKGKGYVNQLRILLVEAVHKTQTLSTFFSDIGPMPDDRAQ